MARLTTSTSLNPAARTFLRSTDAPMAEEPMPASHANTMRRMSSGWSAAIARSS